MMLFYPSKNNNRLNARPFTPDALTGRAMVNPHYRVDLAPSTRYIIDSGAFQERDMHARLQPWQALDRQLRLEAQIEYGGGPDHAEALITYDMLSGVDEALVHKATGVELDPCDALTMAPRQLAQYRRVKRRGTEEKARLAVAETIRSARYYKSAERRVRGGVAYACQGAGPEQYEACARELIPLIRPGRDWFAFGGFCIVGMVPSLKPVLYETLERVLPLLRAAGVERGHLLGVTVTDAIQRAAEIARAHGVLLSTDSSGPERNAAVYGRGFVTHPKPQFKDMYRPDQKFIDYHPADFAMETIGKYDGWTRTL